LVIQCLPTKVCEWLSTVGTAPFVTIHGCDGDQADRFIALMAKTMLTAFV
jgi:hypothetical protein